MAGVAKASQNPLPNPNNWKCGLKTLYNTWFTTSVLDLEKWEFNSLSQHKPFYIIYAGPGFSLTVHVSLKLNIQHSLRYSGCLWAIFLICFTASDNFVWINEQVVKGAQKDQIHFWEPLMSHPERSACYGSKKLTQNEIYKGFSKWSTAVKKGGGTFFSFFFQFWGGTVHRAINLGITYNMYLEAGVHLLSLLWTTHLAG